MQDDPELCVSTVLHAWLYGFVPVLWTHDVWWPAGAYFSIFYAVTWPAIYREYQVLPDQAHLHSSVVLVFWIGAALALSIVWSLHTPKMVDTDPFFSAKHSHAQAELSKTTFHILSVSLFVSAEYFLFQYYEPFFSFGTSLGISALLIILYLFINLGSYLVGRNHHEYKQNAAYLSLVGAILFTHVVGDLIVVVFEDVKRWYGLMHFVVLLVFFYPFFCVYAWRKVCAHDRQKRVRRLLGVTAAVHVFAYLIAWSVDEFTEQRNIGAVVGSLCAYSLLMGLAFVGGRCMMHV